MNARRYMTFASAAAAAALTIAGCSADVEPAATDAADGGSTDTASMSICYITAANSHPYVTPANEGAQAAADAAGVELTIVSEEFSPQTGAEQLDSCVSRGVDGILLWPLDDNSYLPGLIKADEAGIPVVAIDTTTGDDSMALIASFVGADKYDQGTISFNQLDEALDGEGGVIILAGQAGNGTEIARTGGFMDALAESDSNMEVLATVHADFDQQKALVASRDLLTRFGDEIDGVYAEDDTMAKGFQQALEESGLDINPVLIGINGEKGAFESIKAGTQYSTIIQPPFRNGELAIETLIKVMNGETVPDVVLLENTVVDANNVDDHEPAL